MYRKKKKKFNFSSMCDLFDYNTVGTGRNTEEW